MVERGNRRNGIYYKPMPGLDAGQMLRGADRAAVATVTTINQFRGTGHADASAYLEAVDRVRSTTITGNEATVSRRIRNFGRSR